MAKKFSINTVVVPAKSRSNGMVLGGSVGSVVVNQIGENKNNASTVVNNYITNNYNTDSDTYREISIDDLLSLPDESKKIGVLYLVYSGGSADSGWSHDSTFLLNGESYPDGTFVTWNITQWEAVSAEVVNVQNTVKMKPLEKTVYIPTQLSSSTSFPRIQEFIRDGIELMRLKAYEKSEEEGVYEPKSYVSGNKQTHEYSVVVPFAYKEGETYHGGALRAEDYKKLFEGGRDGKDAGFGSVTASVDANVGIPSVVVTTSGDNTSKNFSFAFHNLKGRDGKDGKDGTSVTIQGSYDSLADLQREHPAGQKGDAYIIGLDLYVWNGSQWQNMGQFKGKDGRDGIDGSFYIDTTYVENPSNERVPSTKLFADQIRLLLTEGVPLVVSGRLADYYNKSEINTKLGDYVTSSYLSANYYNKSLLDVSFKALQDSIPTKTSQLSNDSKFATETWVTSQGFTKNIGTITEVKLNGELVGNSGSVNILTTRASSNASAISKLCKFKFDGSNHRYSGAVFFVTERDNVDANHIGFLLVRTGAWSSDGSKYRYNYCRFIRIAESKSTINYEFHATASDVLNPEIYVVRPSSAQVYLTPLHNVKNLQWLDETVEALPESDCFKAENESIISSMIDKSLPSNPSDDRIASTKLFATELAKKEDKHDYILMYYDYRKQYSVQHSSGFTNVEVISELSIRIYPAGCTNKNEMRAYLLNHQIQMKQMKRNASNDTIEVKYDAIYQYTVTDSYIQIGINGSSILSPVSAGEIVYYQFCIQKMSYE